MGIGYEVNIVGESRFSMSYDYGDEEYVFFDGDKELTPSEVVKLLNDLVKETNILHQKVKILRDEIQSTVYILKMQTRKLEGY